MPVQHYSSIDSGAPSLTGTYFDRLRQILLACLVNGYGSKEAAGWTVVHTHAEGIGLSNGEGIAYFAYQDSVRTLAGIADSVVDSINKVPSGDNVQGLSDGLTGSGGNLSGSATHWVLVADDKTAILMFAGGFSSADSTYTSSGAQAMPLYFGRYINSAGIEPAFCMIGWSGTANPWTGTIGVVANSIVGRMSRHPHTGLIEQGASPRYGLGVCSATGALISEDSVLPPLARLNLGRAPIFGFGPGISGGSSYAAAVPCGWARGMVFDPSISSYRLSRVLAAFGKPNSWQERVKAIELPGGKSIVPFYSGPRDIGYFISLDEADWL